MVQVHCSRRRLLQRGLEFHVCTINKSAHTKKVWKLIIYTSYIPTLFSIPIQLLVILRKSLLFVFYVYENYHQIAQTTSNSLTFSCHLSLSSFASSKSLRLPPLFRQSWFKSFLVTQHWHFHVQESIREHHSIIAAFLCNCCQVFSSYAYSAAMWCIHTAILTWLLLGKTALPYD